MSKHKKEFVEIAPTPAARVDAELLRRVAWEIGEGKAADGYRPTCNHVGLAMVTPSQGFAHWRILEEWVERAGGHKGAGWHKRILVLRLYDVSYINFNGLNAHQIVDHELPGLIGRLFFNLQPATWQLAEVGFLLPSGEFVPAARSQAVAFPPAAAGK